MSEPLVLFSWSAFLLRIGFCKLRDSSQFYSPNFFYKITHANAGPLNQNDVLETLWNWNATKTFSNNVDRFLLITAVCSTGWNLITTWCFTTWTLNQPEHIIYHFLAPRLGVFFFSSRELAFCVQLSKGKHPGFFFFLQGKILPKHLKK